MTRQLARTVMISLVAAMIGGVVGAAAYAVLFEQRIERGIVVEFGGNFPNIEDDPFCVEAQHFCIVQGDAGELGALYAYDTHAPSRSQNCEITWRPDMRFRHPSTGEESIGWFRSGCSGTTYRMNGERVFGPGARDMDRFDLDLVTFEANGEEFERIEVDTRELICGEATQGAPEDCELAPLPQ